MDKIFEDVERWLRDLKTHEKINKINDMVDRFGRDFKIPTDKRRTFMGAVWEVNYPWKGFSVKNLGDHPLNYIFVTAFNDQPFVLRGYPKAHKIKHVNFKKPMIVQPSYDGIHVEFFKFPDGKLHAKSRELEYIDGESLYNRSFYKVFLKTGLEEKIDKMLNDYPNLVLIGELYGNNEILRGFVDYDTEVEYKVFDILNRPEYRFLHWHESLDLLEKYDIPHVETLSGDLKKVIQEHEGIVFKHYRKNGSIELVKLESNLKHSIYIEPDNLHSKKMQVCMRKLFETT